MINKPAKYDATKVGGWTPVKAGGHKCVIKKVEEVTSQTGNQMLKVFFDFDGSDSQPGYYMDKYLADKQSKGNEAKWAGVQNVVIDERTEYGVANLKRFVTAVEDSNDGFTANWGATFCKCFENKKVGIVYREEDFEKQDGSIGTAAKPFRFCNYVSAPTQKLPEPKKIKTIQADNEGFYSAPADTGFLFA